MNEGKKEWPMRPHTHRHIHTRTDTHTHTHSRTHARGGIVDSCRKIWLRLRVMPGLCNSHDSFAISLSPTMWQRMPFSWLLIFGTKLSKTSESSSTFIKVSKNNTAICDQNQFTMGQNQVVLRHLIMHFTTSSGVSKWANEQMNERNGVRKQSKQCGARDWVNCASKQANWRASGPVLLFWFLVVPGHSAVRASVPRQNRIELARKAKKQPK